MIKRQLCAVGIPHRKVAILQFADITQLMGKKRTAVQGGIKAVHLRRVLTLHIDGMQTFAPQIGSILHHTVEVQTAVHIVFGIEIGHRLVVRSKGGSRHPFHRLSCLSPEGEPDSDTRLAGHHQSLSFRLRFIKDTIVNQLIFIISQYEMSPEIIWLSPSLIYMRRRIIGINHMVHGINLDGSLSVIIIGLDNEMNQFVLIGRNTEHGGMAQGSHLSLQMLILQLDTIVMGMRYLVLMTESGGTLSGLQTEFASQSS